MSTKKSILLLAVCTCLALCLIIGLAPAPTDGPDSGDSTLAPGSDSLQSAARLYAAAKGKLLSASELAYTYTYQQTRAFAGEAYSETRSGTANYAGLHAEDLEALIQEEVAYGSYGTHFTESYRNGRGYSQVRGTSFVCDMEPDDFLARQVPAVLLNEALYNSAELSGTQITFSDATALECWADPSGKAELISAGGAVTLNDDGQISAIRYQAEYILGTISYTLDVTVAIAVPSEPVHPEYPENCAPISDLEIPRHMLRTVDGVYSTNSASATYTEALRFGVLQETRTKTGGYYFHGSGDHFLANLNYQNTRATATGSTSATSQNNTFRDGQYTCIVNGGEAHVDSSFSAENIRALCDDSILSAMMMPEHIAGAQITDDGDFLRITFQGNDGFILYFCGNIYTAMGLDISLDMLAESSTTQDAGGYLVINKYTGLPTSMGLSLARTHVLNSLPYDMSYRLDQAVTLSCPDAYETITGETVSPTAAEAVTPPFYAVTGPNGEKMWLLGSTDVGDDRAANLHPQVLEALAGSDALLLEYDPLAFMAAAATDPTLQSQLSALYYYSDSTTADHLSEEAYGQLSPLMVTTGYPNRLGLKPIIWQSQIEKLYLTQSYGLTGSIGCEGSLIRLAADQSLPIYEMESGLSKLETLVSLPDDVQELLLKRLLGKGMQAFYKDQLLEYTRWCRGDLDGLATGMEAVTEGMSGEEQQLYSQYHEALVTNRTEMMLRAITNRLESGKTLFCTVDFHNLLGTDGLVEALRAAGYTVEPVSYE